MKYKLMEIKSSPFSPDLKVVISQLTDEREDVVTVPNPAGFYYYPETMKDKDALKTLKEVLLAEMNKRLKLVKKEISDLKTLKLDTKK